MVVVSFPNQPVSEVEFDKNGLVIRTRGSGSGIDINKAISKSLNFRFTTIHSTWSLCDSLYLLFVDQRRFFHSTELNELLTPFKRKFSCVWARSSGLFDCNACKCCRRIFLLQFASRKVQNFVIGSKIETPLLNLMWENFEFLTKFLCQNCNAFEK